MSGVPFDTRRCVVPTHNSRVEAASANPVPGLYASGWLKRGPTGIIATNIPDAKQTAAAVIEDATQHRIGTEQASARGTVSHLTTA